MFEVVSSPGRACSTTRKLDGVSRSIIFYNVTPKAARQPSIPSKESLRNHDSFDHILQTTVRIILLVSNASFEECLAEHFNLEKWSMIKLAEAVPVKMLRWLSQAPTVRTFCSA